MSLASMMCQFLMCLSLCGWFDSYHWGTCCCCHAPIAFTGSGNTIHSVNQLESFGLKVDDKPKWIGGKQCVTTPDGFTIPLAVRCACIHGHAPPTDSEYESLPHILLTGDVEWDPSMLDSEVDLDDLPTQMFKWMHRGKSFPQDPDYHHCNRICMVASLTDKATLASTTQWYKAEERLPMHKHYKSRFPAANVDRLMRWWHQTFFASIEAMMMALWDMVGLLWLSCMLVQQATSLLSSHVIRVTDVQHFIGLHQIAWCSW